MEMRPPMSDTSERVELFCDDFSSYPPGDRLDASYFAAMGASATGGSFELLGPWRQTTCHYSWKSDRIKGPGDCAMPWQIADIDERRWLVQPEEFPNVMLVAGHEAWRNYTFEVDLVVDGGSAGPVVRYHTSRMNYWVRLQPGEPVALIRRTHDEHVTLAAAPARMIEAGRSYRCTVECFAERITVYIDGQPVISVDDHVYGKGCVALRTEGRSRFASARVTTDLNEASSLATRRRRREAALSSARAWFPQPQLIHEVSVPAWADEILLRDINDDGRAEILACEVAVPFPEYTMLARMAAFDWDGRKMWSMGEPKESAHSVRGGFAFNTADIDGDGHTEIIVTRGFEILVIDGATGKVKKSAKTPRSFAGREDRFPRIVGDSVLVCDLRGLGGARDFILKDRHRNLWAYTWDVRPLWHRHLNTGHYPRARDIDGEGKDEIMGGYSLLNSDGSTRWTVPGGDPDRGTVPGSEHMDSCLIERFAPGPDSPLQIAMAASDLGFLLMDVDGTVRAHHRIGHAQRLSAAPFRPDLGGRQLLVQTSWGNKGILNMFDHEGRLLLIRETALGGVQPVNWRGDGGALILGEGCLLDGNFDPVVELPEGEPVSPPSHDVNGDGIDEIVLRQGDAIRMYGPHQAPNTAVRLARHGLTNWSRHGGFYL
jgi:hypothetical protein